MRLRILTDPFRQTLLPICAVCHYKIIPQFLRRGRDWGRFLTR